MKRAPSPTFEPIQEHDPFLALFPHRHDYIWAEHSSTGQKPAWQTENRHPLSDRLIRQGSLLYGVRFGSKTKYGLLDIDINSLYHPQRDPFAISRMVTALEPLGLVKYVACTSSYSGGIHLYFPFEEAQDSYKLARAIQILLKNAGFIFSPGHLELFPTDRGFVDGIPTLYAAHRLPMQTGFYILNSNYDTVWSNQNTFVQHWHFAQQHNQLDDNTLQQVLKAAKRKKYCISGKANKFLNDLSTEIYQGWTDFGQTNHLLGRIAMHSYIFWHAVNSCTPLEGRQLVNQIVEIAKSLPGYATFCRHQDEIEQRAQDWASCVESSHYFPYGIGKSKLERSQGQQQTTPTWHGIKREEARERIRKGIARLLESDLLPAKPTARFNALVKQGIGGGTLYKHKDLWHPEHLIPVESPLLPPHPPLPKELTSGHTEGVPGCTNLLDSQFSNALPNKGLSSIQEGIETLMSSNTQNEERGREGVWQKLLEIKALQESKRAAQKEVWKQHQSSRRMLLARLAALIKRMQQWLESDDPILIAEAEAFFAAYRVE